MKHSIHYKKLTWLTIFVVILGLALGYYVFQLNGSSTSNTVNPNNPDSFNISEGTLTNEVFSILIEDNITEYGFAENIIFTSNEEGHFTVNGKISSPDRLLAVCNELKPFETILKTLEGESITINGHLGENENGNGCFITDTITVSGITIPAGIATDYIEKYTGLNALLEVPFEQIELSEKGITFKESLPNIIQTALYK